MIKRPRRHRTSRSIRRLVEEFRLGAQDFLMPLFVMEGDGCDPIPGMPGQFRRGREALLEEVAALQELGLLGVCLFPFIPPGKKTRDGAEALNPEGFYLRRVSELKEMFPEMLVVTDVALDPYSPDGHDGIVGDNGEILNDESVGVLTEMALLQAQAGSDIIGPSDMMDGRVGAIRRALEDRGFAHTLIMSYTAKYASAFYGPFRDALGSAPKGDKKTYQMNPGNLREALREARLDEEEGADMLMVKPGLAYLDVIAAIRGRTDLPLAGFNVSGEYAMVKLASERGLIDENRAVMEMLVGFKRAGCDIVISYFAKRAAALLRG